MATQITSKKVNYQSMRAGKVLRRDRSGKPVESVAVCPRCGRKGMLKAAAFDDNGDYWPREIYHTGIVRSMGGFSVLELSESCDVREPFDWLLTAGTRRAKAARRAAARLTPDSDWPALPLL